MIDQNLFSCHSRFVKCVLVRCELLCGQSGTRRKKGKKKRSRQVEKPLCRRPLKPKGRDLNRSHYFFPFLSPTNSLDAVDLAAIKIKLMQPLWNTLYFRTVRA